jgi:hypothetical protein
MYNVVGNNVKRTKQKSTAALYQIQTNNKYKSQNQQNNKAQKQTTDQHRHKHEHERTSERGRGGRADEDEGRICTNIKRTCKLEMNISNRIRHRQNKTTFKQNKNKIDLNEKLIENKSEANIEIELETLNNQKLNWTNLSKCTQTKIISIYIC